MSAHLSCLKTKLTKLNQYGKEIKMDEEINSVRLAVTPVPAKKSKTMSDSSRKHTRTTETTHKSSWEALNTNTSDFNSHHFPGVEDFNYLRVESPHKLGKATSDGYKFIASSSVQVNSHSQNKNSLKNQFASFQSQFYEGAKPTLSKAPI